MEKYYQQNVQNWLSYILPHKNSSKVVLYSKQTYRCFFLNETDTNHISFWFLEVFIKMLGIIFQRAKYWFLKIMPWFLEEMSMTKETKRGWICDIWNITFMGTFWVMNHFQDTFVVRDIWKLKLKYCLLSIFHVTSKPQLNDNPTPPKLHKNYFAPRPPQYAQSTRFSCRHVFGLPCTIAKIVIWSVQWYIKWKKTDKYSGVGTEKHGNNKV